MTTKKWVLILAVTVAVAQEIQTACVCNEKGTDACAACSEIKVVRPKPKPPKSDLGLPPIGDNCWCSKMMIQPASLPKPCPKSTKPPPPCGCPAAKPYKAIPSIFSAPTSYMVPQYVPSLVKDDSPPADPISISLAIQAGKAIEVPEAKLAYGFVQKPIDGLPKLYISSIKEENLYALKSDVITLKKPLPPKMKPLEDDYPEPEDEEPAPEEYEPPTLTYKQLGYEAEQFKNPEFKELPPSLPYPPPSAPAAIQGKVAVDCGFRPGRIAKYCL
ncbi:hypothetical protein CVS40_2419 [Lucilia cuprina]|nr:hypothetical protein CVS40_2419 [Lucilia cuprina]